MYSVAAEAKAKETQRRCDLLQSVEATLPIVQVEAMSTEDFDGIFAGLKSEHDAKIAKQAEEEAARKAESDRLAAIAKEQAERQAELDRKEAEIAAERQRKEDELAARQKAIEEAERVSQAKLLQQRAAELAFEDEYRRWRVGLNASVYIAGPGHQ